MISHSSQIAGYSTGMLVCAKQQQPLPGPQLQQGFNLGPPQLIAQPTGFSPQRPQGFQQPQQTGFQPSSGFLQSQPTGFAGGTFQQQARPAPPPPPVPPLPTQLQQPSQSLSFLNAPPPPQQSGFFTPSSSVMGGMASQPTGFGARTAAPLIAQPTGFVDPRLQLMSNTFMPMNTSAPYSAAGAPLLAPQQQNLHQSFQQYQGQRGTPAQPMSWTLSKAEKKNYDQIFRSWDAQGTGSISGQAALEVFGASGLQKEELARIWSLADKDNQGKLNIAEFHVAMGLIFRRLSGMPIPEQLPPELVPPSARDLGSSVDMLKDLLKHESRSRSPAGLDAPVSRLKNRSFNSTSPSFESSRDATIYKHDDAEPPGGFYQPRSRHVNRDNVRSRTEQGAAADLLEMKRKLANTAEMLDRTAAAEAAKTAEDEELEQEMEDLRREVEQVSDDLDYVSRGPRTAAKDGEKRQLERHLMNLMHERIPDLERKIKARDEKKEREKRQWIRDRDRANERFGKYDSKDDGYSSRKYDDRDRPYSRGAYDRGDRDRPYSRGAYDQGDRDNAYDKDDGRRDYNRPTPRGDISRSSEQERERTRTPPRSTRSTPPAPSAPTLSAREAPPPKSSPSPAPLKNMTAEERQAYAKAEARRRIEARMAALGVTTPSTATDTSVEERLQQEKKEAEEKARVAEKQAEERERLRRERLESEKALKESKVSSTSISPTTATTARPAPAPAPVPAPTPKSALRPPKPKAPAPPPPRRVPTVQVTPSAPPPTAKQAIVQPTVPNPPAAPQIDPEEEALRMREEALRKQREARAERLRQLEKEEEEAARREEERYQARMQALAARATAQPDSESISAMSPSAVITPPSAPPTRQTSSPMPPSASPAPTHQTSSPMPPSGPQTAVTPSADKSTNPFSRFINKDAEKPISAAASTSDGSTNPWARATTSPAVPSPPKSPLSATKPTYNTAPSSSIDDDWDEIKENESDDDSSDDEIVKSRATRANIAEQLFGSMLPRPTSAAANSPVTSPTSVAASIPPPPPPPSAPAPPPAPSAPAVSGPGDVNALMRSIQGGMKLRPTKTIDKSGPPVAGRVMGESAPPVHINGGQQSFPPPSPPSFSQALPEPIPMAPSDEANLDNRQSVGWFANRAVDAGLSNSWVDVLPTTAEGEEQEEKPTIPTIQVDQPIIQETENDLLSDIDKSQEYRVRTLYPFVGDGPDDLSFEENLMILANPSKSGGDWWYGTVVSTQTSGLFPKTFVEVVQPIVAKALYDYAGSNTNDELQFNEGDIISIIDRSDEEWWKAERDGVVYIVPATYVEVVEDGDDECSDHSTSDYLSFESDNDETGDLHASSERERQMVLEAAGLIVNQEVNPPPATVRSISTLKKSQLPPIVPRRRTTRSGDPYKKDLPPLPDAEPMDHAARLDDAYERFESYRNQQLSTNRLSLISTDSSLHSPSSMKDGVPSTPKDNENQRRYSQFFQLFSGLRGPEPEKRTVSTLTISGPISGASSYDISRSGSPAFGSSWASLVDSSALEGMPTGERKRQEAIFELIITEEAYVRDLQLIVEIFYASMMPMLSEKEVTVIFANIEDILLTNTTFLSSLEERQKDCRLYIDKIGDIFNKHLPNMGVYVEYCANQATAAQVLQSLRETNHELADHLQQLRDTNPAIRSLDLASYLLAPMQRITKYPLLIKQIQQYTTAEDETEHIRDSIHTAEALLERINETIREQESHERLRIVSQYLWIGTGRLDLTAPTRYMGPRKLLREGLLIKAKSGRRLHGFLCSDILVLTDASMKTLYRLPIPLAHSQASVVSTSRDELTFEINQSYPRGGDKIVLKTKPARDGQAWVDNFNKASRRCHRAEERTHETQS
ncbi:hypothetical protein M378DRAFT_184914 [Amanita muscaria Koide BX008]|uniref:Actin cytoskeleton-regulatory complex protein PAN1 n=1 Tax=Amanita muscaria (strain Koide BX008) TaxID=946122 RepID=A0A0C2XHP3_AMAMK|nr:hypothetical protein M378DRAFT_184914 [Amanita muscaria Koide BX008]